MKLPNSDKAYIPDAKLTDYLLSPSHPEGGPKSIFFQTIGYSLDNLEDLRNKLIHIASTNEVVEHYEFEFGSKYIIDGVLPRKKGDGITIRTVWVIDKGQSAPRFITAYPL